MRNIKRGNNRGAHKLEEEVLRHRGIGHVVPPNGERADPKLRDKDEDVERQPDVGAQHAHLRLEGQLADLAAVVAPRAPEADVAEADGAPGENTREARQGEKPVEDAVLAARVSEV